MSIYTHSGLVQGKTITGVVNPRRRTQFHKCRFVNPVFPKKKMKGVAIVDSVIDNGKKITLGDGCVLSGNKIARTELVLAGVGFVCTDNHITVRA